MKLGWEPKTSLEKLVKEMVAFDKEEAIKESFLNKEGFKVNASIESVPYNPEK